MNIREELLALKELGYKRYSSILIPTVEADRILGIRTPILKKFAKEIKKTDEAKEFLSNPKHYYLEENNLHTLLISEIRDYDECMAKVKEFLPYIDNWATCDCFKPRCFKKNKDKLIEEIKGWLKSDLEYVVRFAVSMLLTHYLEDDFKEEYLCLVASVNQDRYYISMVVAWYFSTALVKQYDSAIKYLQDKRLSEETHNRTIQKCLDSFRIKKDKKEYLRTLKIKIAR